MKKIILFFVFILLINVVSAIETKEHGNYKTTFLIGSGVTTDPGSIEVSSITGERGVGNYSSINYLIKRGILYLITVNETQISSCKTLVSSNTVYTITQDISAAGNCLIIGADNITIDFAGYNITGNETGSAVYNPGYDNLVIRNGYIYEFYYGIYFSANTGNKITNITANSNTYGIYLSSSDNNNLSANIVNSNSLYGIYLDSSSNNTLSKNNINDNIGTGVKIAYGNNNLAINNTCINNLKDFSFTPDSLSELNITNATLEILTSDAAILWRGINFSSTNINETIVISPNSVFVNSSLNPGLNQSATISINNTDSLGFVDRFPLRDGVPCPSSICTEITDVDNYVFNVTQFTTYSVGGTSPAKPGPVTTGGGGGGTRPTRVTAFCGDGVCGKGEDCMSCSEDCGACQISDRMVVRGKELNKTLICVLCLESLKEHIKEKRDINYSEEEIEVLTLTINRELEINLSNAHVRYLINNFEDECKLHIPLLAGLAVGRYRALLFPFVTVGAFIILLFFIFLYFRFRKLKKLFFRKRLKKKTKRGRKRKVF